MTDIQKVTFASLIKAFVAKNGIKVLVEEAQVTERTARRWISGQSTPSLHPQRLQISKLIGCPYNVMVSLIDDDRPVKVYVACGLNALGTARHVMRSFEAIGCEITYDWTQHGAMNHAGVKGLAAVAEKELQGVLDCDILVLCYPYGRRGSHFEMGVAYQSKKDIVIVSDEDFDIQNLPSFYTLDGVSTLSNFKSNRAHEAIFGEYGTIQHTTGA